jgi:cyanophycin synthetase
MELHLEGLTEKESRDLPGFNDRLLDLLPGLMHHHCSRGRPGGFFERLVEGTYFGHVVEHVALELTELAGVPTFHGKTRLAGEEGRYNVIIEYTAEKGTRYLLESAVELVESLLSDDLFPLQERLDKARKIIARTETGPSTTAIVDAARRRDIPCRRIGDGSIVQLGHGKNRKFIQAAMSSSTSAVAVEIASDKELTIRLLGEASMPVPFGVVVESEGEAREALGEIGPPVAVKPLDGQQARGISLNLSSPEQVEHAFRIAREHSPRVVVQQMLRGRDYRVLVVNGKMIAASQRVPAHVTGDGSHTIAELIDIINRDPLRGVGHEKSLTRIKIDDLMIEHLKKRGLTTRAIPASGETVSLRECANLSVGGTARDVTDIVHPEIAELCERAARIIGLDICGIDLVLPDIRGPLDGGGIIEINASPGLRMHLSPSEGEGRDVGSAIVDMIYPPGSTGRIPILSITGTNGKTTITRMIAHVLARARLTVGLTTTDGIYVGGELVFKGDATGPRSARAVLSDPAVEVAVLETARGGIARGGLGYDWSDISIISNVRLDHIGQDGIAGLDDLLFIKSLVAERVREGGTLVLNADDERLARLMESERMAGIQRNVIYFSMRPNHVLIRRHLAAGGTAYVFSRGWIVEATPYAQTRIERASSIPVTLNGAAAFHIANSLAAVAACRAFGVEREAIAASLKGFRADLHNSGRANLYEVAGGHVMIDYGHNPDAFEAVCRMAAQWEASRVTGVVGVPGDRNDSVIEQAGRAAARGFHRIFIREDKDLRGREKDEVARLLSDAARSECPDRECRIIHDETAALETAVREIKPGEVVIIFYEKLGLVLDVLRRHGAAPVSYIPEPSPALNPPRRAGGKISGGEMVRL